MFSAGMQAELKQQGSISNGPIGDLYKRLLAYERVRKSREKVQRKANVKKLSAYKVPAISFGIGITSILTASYIILRVRPETYLWLLPIEFLLLVSLSSLVVSVVAGVNEFKVWRSA